MAPIAEPIAPA